MNRKCRTIKTVTEQKTTDTLQGESISKMRRVQKDIVNAYGESIRSTVLYYITTASGVTEVADLEQHSTVDAAFAAHNA